MTRKKENMTMKKTKLKKMIIDNKNPYDLYDEIGKKRIKLYTDKINKSLNNLLKEIRKSIEKSVKEIHQINPKTGINDTYVLDSIIEEFKQRFIHEFPDGIVEEFRFLID
jgi:DNA-directed RNA polymerase beta subunit